MAWNHLESCHQDAFPSPLGCHVSLAGDPNPSRWGFSSAGSSQREDRKLHILPVLRQRIQEPSCLGSQTVPGLSFLPKHCRLGHLLLCVLRAGAGSPELSLQDSAGARECRESCLSCDAPVEKTLNVPRTHVMSLEPDR